MKAVRAGSASRLSHTAPGLSRARPVLCRRSEKFAGVENALRIERGFQLAEHVQLCVGLVTQKRGAIALSDAVFGGKRSVQIHRYVVHDCGQFGPGCVGFGALRPIP